jgi:hypothetical protein
MAAAGCQPRQDLLSAAGKPLDTPRDLTAGFHLDMDNPPRSRQDGKTVCHGEQPQSWRARAKYPPFWSEVGTMLIKTRAIQIWEFCAPASRYGRLSLALSR